MNHRFEKKRIRKIPSLKSIFKEKNEYFMNKLSKPMNQRYPRNIN